MPARRSREDGRAEPSVRSRRFHATPRHVGAAHAGRWTIGEVIRTFKAVSIRQVRQAGEPSFAWQRNYYEHIIRNEDSLLRIRQYIRDNPERWAFDPDNPGGIPDAREALFWRNVDTRR